ncbi:hypothetical protein FRC07_009694, partial [Ceratobasidium sp. 392]
MRLYKLLVATLSLLGTQIQLVRSHAVIADVVGDNGVRGVGFGTGSPNGGNSATAKSVVLTAQETEKFKADVKGATSEVIEIMATGATTPTVEVVATQANRANSDLATTRNREMSTSFLAGLATSIPQPVGQPAGTAGAPPVVSAIDVVALITKSNAAVTPSS